MPDISGVLLNIQRTPATLPNSSTLRAEGTFRFPNELAAYLLLVLPLLLAYALRVPSKVERVSTRLVAGMTQRFSQPLRFISNPFASVEAGLGSFLDRKSVV